MLFLMMIKRLEEKKDIISKSEGDFKKTDKLKRF
jgi:hypothetical protein